MLLSTPMEKSFADVGEELDKVRGKDESAGDYKDHYGIWIKRLEDHHMTDEYRLALSRLIDETAAFRITGNEVLTEFLGFLPIPTNKEMDGLYKEFYMLKKLSKDSAKKISKLESALAK